VIVPLAFPPGVYRNGTIYQAKGRWYDSDLARWSNGSLGPVGGWRVWTNLTNTTTGIPRSAVAWTDNSNNRWVGVGTASKLHVYDDSGVIYDITPAGFAAGYADASAKTGYGDWLYGRGTFGDERPDTGTRRPATSWALETWGEDLIGCTQEDGKLYLWDASVGTGTVAAVITNAPTSNYGVVVTGERFVVALGAGGNRRKVQWSGQETETVWTPAATNQAGSLELATNGTLVCGRVVRGQTLLLTTQDAFSMSYIGPPFIFSFEKVGANCGPVSQMAIVTADNQAFWMGERGFWVYDGYTRPLPCDVVEWVQDNISEVQSSKTIAWHNEEYNEVWWIFPNDATNENAKYVSYNYRENHWAIGALARTAVAHRGSFDHPFLWDSAGQPYEHEVGTAWGGGAGYAESGPLEIGDGDRVLSATSLIPDEKTLADTQVTIYARMYPTDSDTTHGPYSMAQPTDVRFTARSIRLRVTGITANEWRVGVPRLDARPGGRR